MTAPLVYVAGAVDYVGAYNHKEEGAPHVAELWPAGVTVFCPRCENEGETNDEAVMRRNWDAVNDADVMVAFISTAQFSVGTPIEVWEKARQRPESVVVVHWSEDGALGLFVRWWQSRGVEVINAVDGLTQDEAIIEAVREAVRRRLVIQ